MATPNFARPQNASKFFVVLTNREEEYKECTNCNEKHYAYDYNLETTDECTECEAKLPTEIETETQAPHEFEYKDLKDNLGSDIAELGGTALDEAWDNDRSYNRQAVGSLSSDKYYGDLEVSVKLTVVVQSAYYEGATLDYLIEIDNGEVFEEVDENDTIEDIIDDLFQVEYNDDNYSDMSKGLRIIQSKNAVKWVENEIQQLSKQIEVILENYSSHKLQCDGVFSNGEAIYSEIKD